MQRAGSVAKEILEAIRELDRHIEHQRWSSNCKAIADRERLITALIDIKISLNADLRQDADSDHGT